MTTLRRDAVLNDVRSLFDLGVVSNLTDGQLLDRIATRDGERAGLAFSVLVERHGAMVLRVCRQILSDPHDVEDAFQATFLVLLRKARAIRNPRSCGSWLHGVALRSAATIRSAEARRKWHERRAAKDPGAAVCIGEAEPIDDPRCVIDEELGRLQDLYRAPLVLCYLEGRTCEDAARQLGWPVGTVKSRLSRGRERLRQRLVRRGLAPVLGLTASLDLPALASETVPAGLATKVGEEAARVLAGTALAGAVSTTVASLVRGELRRGLLGLAARLGAAMLGMGFVVSVLGLAGVGKDDVEAPKAAAAPGKVETDPVHVRVVDREGKPVAGAKVQVSAMSQPARTVTTDADGGVVVPREQVGDYASFLARHGDSLGWAVSDSMRPNEPGTGAHPLVLVLLPVNHTVEGSVVDPKGQPIANVLIVVEAVARSGQLGVIMPRLQLERDGWPLGSAVTNDQGRYTLTLPEKTGANLCAIHQRFTGPWIGAHEDARMIDPVTLEPAGGITGKVTDVQTGAPVAGAHLGAQLVEHHNRNSRGGAGEAVSDARGEFSLGGLEPGVYCLGLRSVPGRTHAVASAVDGVRVRALEDTRADLRVVDGRPLRVVVSDSQTNQPVAGILVGCYGPAHPRSGAAVESRRTDDQGQFTFFVPPGEHLVYLMDGSSRSRLSSSVVVVPEQGEAGPVRLIRVSGTANRPPEAFKAEIKKEAVKAVATETKKSPAKPVAPEPKTPEGRTVTGLVTDREGRPLAGVSVYIDLHRSAPGEPRRSYNSAATDRAGVFILRNLPQHALTLLFNRPDAENSTPLSQPIAADQDVVDFVFAPGPNQQRPPYRHDPPVDEAVPQGLKEHLTFVNLDPRGTEFLADGPGGVGNDLARLPRGVHKMGATYYRVGEKLIHLRGRNAPGLPGSVAGIVVGDRGHKLHIVHAAHQGDPMGTEVAIYNVHYVDGTTVRIPVVYGRDVASWWLFPNGVKQTPSDATLAWTGTNDVTDMNPGLTLRLFATTWTNPHPDRVIATIGVTSKETTCDVFLVALTLERIEPPGPK